MIDINIKVDGLDQMKRSLGSIADNVRDLKPFWNKALDIMEDRIDEVFANEGANITNASNWQGLADSTLKAREKRWGYYKNRPNNPGTLRWTGKLQDDKAKEVSSKKASLTMNAPYAVYHQRGGANLPQRLIIDLDENAKREIARAMQNVLHSESRSLTRSK